MAYNPPTKSNDYINENFSEAVIRLMKQKCYNQSDLVRHCALSKTTVSRILRNSNDKGTSYQPSQEIVMALCIGLRLTPEEGQQLTSTAFPGPAQLNRILSERMNIREANELFHDLGLPLLGNPPE